MWRTIHMSGDVTIYCSRVSRLRLEKICRYAIDLSNGHLEDITISRFGTDGLLEYMSHRASHLRRLLLFGCNGISDKGLSEFVKKFSLLEELSCNNRVSKDSLEVIGRCCPLLKSLYIENISFPHSINGGSVYSSKESDGSFAIAKTMSGLHHLKLYGFLLYYDGLLAILDGCPLLESLNLREKVP